MNEKNTVSTILLLSMYCLSTLFSNAQSIRFYEFEDSFTDMVDTCIVLAYGDSMLVVKNLFQENNFPETATFVNRDGCIYLTILGQEGLFFGDDNLGSWQIGEESEKITLKWDTIICSNLEEIIYKFEFIPYYSEDNPYNYDDGTSIYYVYDDVTQYFWTIADGIIAFGLDWIALRKDKKQFVHCLSTKPCSD